MRIALTGASGFIGSTIARHLLDAGHSVTALVRETSRRDHIETVVDRFVVGNQDDESAWPELLDEADAVVHNAVDWAPLKGRDFEAHLASNVIGSLRLLHASAPRPFVFMSTIAVHHDMRPRWDGVVDEDHPSRPGTWYGAGKATVEAHLFAEHHSTGRHTVALRPCAVYGIDPDLERAIGTPILRSIHDRTPYERAGGGKFVHVDDVAAATLGALTHADAAGQVFNLVDCYARWTDWAVLAAEVLGIEATTEHTAPAEPKNMFTPDAARTLGARLDRGHAGIRAQLEALRPLVLGS